MPPVANFKLFRKNTRGQHLRSFHMLQEACNTVNYSVWAFGTHQKMQILAEKKARFGAFLRPGYGKKSSRPPSYEKQQQKKTLCHGISQGRLSGRLSHCCLRCPSCHETRNAKQRHGFPVLFAKLPCLGPYALCAAFFAILRHVP